MAVYTVQFIPSAGLQIDLPQRHVAEVDHHLVPTRLQSYHLIPQCIANLPPLPTPVQLADSSQTMDLPLRRIRPFSRLRLVAPLAGTPSLRWRDHPNAFMGP